MLLSLVAQSFCLSLNSSDPVEKKPNIYDELIFEGITKGFAKSDKPTVEEDKEKLTTVRYTSYNNKDTTNKLGIYANLYVYLDYADIQIHWNGNLPYQIEQECRKKIDSEQYFWQFWKKEKDFTFLETPFFKCYYREDKKDETTGHKKTYLHCRNNELPKSVLLEALRRHTPIAISSKQKDF